MGLTTTSTGGMPRPTALRHARRRFAHGEIDAALFRTAENVAMRELIALQEAAGLDLLVDGQADRSDLVSFFAGRLEGIETGELVRIFGNRYYRRPVIRGPVARKASLTVEHFTAARAAANRPVKAVLTGPYTLMDWSFDEHYASREACCLAIADALAAEVADLAAAGATELQLDEPALSGRRADMPLFAEALGRVVSGLPGNVRVWLRTAYGDVAPLLDDLYALPVHVLSFEMANSGFALLDALGGFPADKTLGAGVMDVLAPCCESADAVRRNIERVLAVVAAERVIVHPDSDLRTLALDDAGARLATLVRAARL